MRLILPLNPAFDLKRIHMKVAKISLMSANDRLEQYTHAT